MALRGRESLRTRPCFQASSVDLLLETLQISSPSLISELEAHSIEGCSLGPRNIERTRDKEVVRKFEKWKQLKEWETNISRRCQSD